MKLPTIVQMDLNDILMAGSLDEFLLMLSERATGSPLLMDITYRVVGSSPTNDVFIEVDGDPSAIEEDVDEVVLRAECLGCGGKLFETDPALSREHGSIVWSHEGTPRCDDPTPVEDKWRCPGCGAQGEPQEALGRKPDRYFLVLCKNAKCEYEDYWHVPFTEEDYSQLSFLEAATDAEAVAAKAEHDKDRKEDR